VSLRSFLEKHSLKEVNSARRFFIQALALLLLVWTCEALAEQDPKDKGCSTSADTLAQAACQSLGAERTVTIGNARQAQLHLSNDQGPVAASRLLRGMKIALRPGAAQRRALEQFLAEQQNPNSANYRHWLTPEEFGERFGASRQASEAVAAWLIAEGMTDVQVSRGRMFVSFQGTAGTAATAFHTAIHAFNVDGRQHFANVSAPSIPASLSGIVADVVGLHDFNPVPQLVHGASLSAQYAAGGGVNDLAPGDLATIYNMNSLYAHGVTGSGTTVAVLGQTPITLDDDRAYRQKFGLAANDFQTVDVPNRGDGTGDDCDQEEATLDVEVLGAVAPNATVLYVWGATAIDAAQYVVDNKLAQVMSLSYAGCEYSSAVYYQTIAQQANAEGITWIGAAGDSGAAGCDPILAPDATNGLVVTSPASVPEVTAVGGTAFADSSSSQYWSATNSTSGGSALSYVPETGWSSQSMVLGGGGGVSGVFAKAGYQSDFDTAVTGGRMVPDVSLAAATGSNPYLIIYNGSELTVGGTSAATPVFAGITALVNRYLVANGSIANPGLGNINPTLYLLAEKIPGVFHDVTAGSNDVPCTVGTPDCATGTLGYQATSGYDLATGLGSVDAYALASNWTNVTLGQSSLTLAASAAQTQASQSVTFTAKVTGEGGNVSNSPVVFYYSNPQSQLAPVSLGSALTDANGTATVVSAVFPSGSNAVTAVYGGSTTVAAGAESNSVSIAVTAFPTTTAVAITGGPYHAGELATFAVTVSAQSGVALGGPVPADAHFGPGSVSLYSADGTLQAQSPVAGDGSANLTSKSLVAGNNSFYVSYSGNYYASQSQSSPMSVAASQAGAATTTALTASATTIMLGCSVTLSAAVSGQSGSGAPTGSVTFYNGTTALGTAPLNGAGAATLSIVPAYGTASLTAVYAGDDTYNGSTSAPVQVTVGTAAPGDFTLSGTTSATISTGSSAVIALSVMPINGFSGTILLSCTGLPAGYACNLPSAVTPQCATPVSVTIAAAPATLAGAIPLAMLSLFLTGGAIRRRKFALLALLGVVCLLTTSCGAGFSVAASSTVPASPTSSQTFTARVLATSGSISHELDICVTVNQ
jgi:hypothetical protein